MPNGDAYMRRVTKKHVLFLSAAAILGLGIMGVDAYADKTSKEERLAQMERDFNKQKEALIHSQRTMGALAREKKGEMNFKIGFFRDMAAGTFQEGEYLEEIRR